jgi:hypothetical protein
MDLVVGASDGTLSYYWNNCTMLGETFTPAFLANGTGGSPFLAWDLGDNAAPAFMDMDKDIALTQPLP